MAADRVNPNAAAAQKIAVVAGATLVVGFFTTIATAAMCALSAIGVALIVKPAFNFGVGVFDFIGTFNGGGCGIGGAIFALFVFIPLCIFGSIFAILCLTVPAAVVVFPAACSLWFCAGFVLAAVRHGRDAHTHRQLQLAAGEEGAKLGVDKGIFDALGRHGMPAKTFIKSVAAGIAWLPHLFGKNAVPFASEMSAMQKEIEEALQPTAETSSDSGSVDGDGKSNELTNLGKTVSLAVWRTMQQKGVSSDDRKMVWQNLHPILVSELSSPGTHAAQIIRTIVKALDNENAQTMVAGLVACKVADEDVQ
ncbi:MAG: hypothetical protein LBP65_03660 [Puniceicoccales bacterium]|nr:hypothetical protein [Puniceicoccales bacterium]